MNKSQSFVVDGSKPIMRFDVTTLDDVKADTNQTR